MYQGKRVVVVMPAYNAARTIERTHREVLEQKIVDLVIVVDDASRDETVALAQRLERTEVHHHARNRGYGANQKTCYRLALEAGADVVIMVHPDYQYTPKLIPAMVALVASGLFPCVLGSRIIGGSALDEGMPFWRYVANRFLTFVENLLLGAKLSEYHTGYRAFDRAVLERLPLEENSDDFVFDNQVIAEILWLGLPIGEVSCPARYQPDSSSIDFARSVRYGLGCLATAASFRLAKWGLLRSPRFPGARPSDSGRHVALAGFLALAVWYFWTLGRPSFWLDEAWEANYYVGYEEAPWYNRPVLFMALSRAMASWLGPEEWALRLLPCLAALGAIGVTYLLARRAWTRGPSLLAAGLLSVFPPFLFAAHQLKNYAFDALFTALLLLAWMRDRDRGGGRSLALYVLLGFLSFGLTFTGIFVLAAIFLVEVASPRRPRRALLVFAGAHVLLAAAFLLVYLGLYAEGGRDPRLVGYFVEEYAPLGDPSRLPGWLALQIVGATSSLAGASSGRALVVLLAAGFLAAVRSPISPVAWAGAAALGFQFLASGFGLYPFGVPRLTLYITPVLALWIVSAIVVVAGGYRLTPARGLAVAALVYALFQPSLREAAPYFTTGWRREHIRPLVEALDRERAPGEAIVLNQDTQYAFTFYWRRLGNDPKADGVIVGGRFRRDPVLHRPWVEWIAARHDRVWGLFTHMPPHEIEGLRELLLEHYVPARSLVEGDARLDLYLRRDRPNELASPLPAGAAGERPEALR